MFQAIRVAIVVVIAVFSALVSGADLQSCQRAYNEGNVSLAYDRCLPLAQSGDPQGAFMLARLYALEVEGHRADWQKVFEWLTVAAAGNHAEAAYNLAIAYQKGKGTPVNLARSIQFYRQSVELGNPKAMRNLALLYEQGEGVEKDAARAFSLYQRSAKAGLADSQLKVGLMLLQGKGVVKDLTAARDWIEQSAEAGNDKAQLALASMLTQVDVESAVTWYERAIAANNPYAAHNLALIYFDGRAVPQDLLQALHYAAIGIKLGSQQTQFLYDEISGRLQTVGIEPLSVEKALAVQSISWLKRQSPARSTMQLGRFSHLQSALRFLTENQLEGRAWVVSLNSDDYVVLLQANFIDKSAAQVYKTQLSSALNGDVWIRPYGSLYAD